MHACTYTCACTYTRTCVSAYIHTYIHTYIQREEEHHLVLSAKFEKDDVTCPEPISVSILPSTIPHRVGAFSGDGEELPSVEISGSSQHAENPSQRWLVSVEAGAELCDVSFRMFDEAGGDIVDGDYNGWTVKWKPTEKAVNFRYGTGVSTGLCMHVCIW
jgi:hypothetical protein